MELFKQISIDWLRKKWWFFGLSWVLIMLGIVSYIMHDGLKYGIDFTGGTVIYLKFKDKPSLDLIRKSVQTESISPPLIQSYGTEDANEVQVRLQTSEIESGQKELLVLLRQEFDPDHAAAADGAKPFDFNNIGKDAFANILLESDPDNLSSQDKTTQEITAYYKNLAQSLLAYRNETSKGLVSSLDDVKKAHGGVSDAVVASLKEDFYAGPFAIKGMDRISARVGSDLRRRATLAVLLSFLGMLVYIAFRFKPIYGVAAVIALFHDLAVTLGLFAFTQKEISLTVIAALLTIVGYSMNDTIVVFDRVRENLRIMRKETHFQVLNLSINQTFARTIMVSFTTFVSVLALFVFGGEVLNGFAFALTVGILIGTYSSIGIASPIVEWWYRHFEQKSKRRTA